MQYTDTGRSSGSPLDATVRHVVESAHIFKEVEYVTRHATVYITHQSQEGSHASAEGVSTKDEFYTDNKKASGIREPECQRTDSFTNHTLGSGLAHPSQQDGPASQSRPLPVPCEAYHRAHGIADVASTTRTRIACDMTPGMELWYRRNNHLVRCRMPAQTPRVRMSSRLLTRSETWYLFLRFVKCCHYP